VACRVALAARAGAARRQAVEQPIVHPLKGPAPDPAAEAAWRELSKVLDTEINRLADRYRLPFILCYFEGKSNAEAARALGCPVGTIESRLVRARARLRAQLTRRGLALSSGLLALALTRASASAASPASLVVPTARAATLFAAGSGTLAGPVSANVFALTEEVLRTMLLSKVKAAAIVAVVTLLVSAAAGLLSRPVLASWLPPDKQTAPAQQAMQAKSKAQEPTKQSIESGTIEKIDLKEGTIVLQESIAVNQPFAFQQDYAATPFVFQQNYPTIVANPSVNLIQNRPFMQRGGLMVPQQDIFYTPNQNLTQWLVPYNMATWANGQMLISWVQQEVRRRLGPAVTVVIDGKEAKLGDLVPKISVQVTLNKDSLVTRIEANGSTLDDCLVDSLDPVNHKLSVGHQGKPRQYEIGPGVDVVINGKKGGLGDVKPEMPVSLRFSALRQMIIGIQAQGPIVECILKKVDAEAGTLTISLKKEHITVGNLHVAEGSPIQIDGHPARLVDLQSRIGKPISIRMDADPERNWVVAVTCNPAKTAK
jgi:Sigma-70, region 4